MAPPIRYIRTKECAPHMRHSDIIVCTPEKAGTTWMMVMIPTAFLLATAPLMMYVSVYLCLRVSYIAYGSSIAYAWCGA
jgi:hypothetical protein